MILRMTKKARDKIKLKDSELVVPLAVPVFLEEWYINTFFLERKKYFFFTESKTLYSVVLDSKGINSKREMELAFSRVIARAIAECFPLLGIERFEVQSIQIAKTENKAVLGSQVDLIYMAQARAYHSGVPDFQRINETPMSYLKYGSPEEEFKKEFDRITSRDRANNRGGTT